MVQAVDFTTLAGICSELQCLIPAKVEQVIQSDSFTIHLILRTLKGKNSLLLCWHPQLARFHLSSPPPSIPNSFVFGQQVGQKLKGLALLKINFLCDWERVIVLSFGIRPHATIDWKIHLEIMGKHSNVMLINNEGTVVSLAHQVSDRQSRLRPIGTGDLYIAPPSQVSTVPEQKESYADWQSRLSIIPQSIKESLWKLYRGVSPHLAQTLLEIAKIDTDKSNQSLTDWEWKSLFDVWQTWLKAIALGCWQIRVSDRGYALIPNTNDSCATAWHINQTVDSFYTKQQQQNTYQQLTQKIQQVVDNRIVKLRNKIQDFNTRIQESDRAEIYRREADLLCAYAHQWHIGMSKINLRDFDTEEVISIVLDPTLNAFQNAQLLYKKHQKQKRTRSAIEPLLQESVAEFSYLESIQVALANIKYDDQSLTIIKEIEQELVAGGYITNQHFISPKNKKNTQELNCHRCVSPSGYSIWIGRNNLQNEKLSLQIANDYDLWFHAQEISGSHVLLRMSAGDTASDLDMQMCADLAAYFSKAKLSDRVPVVYTKPKHLHRPKGGKLGMVIYQQEQLWWGCPLSAKDLLANSA